MFGKSNHIWIEGEGMLHALYFSKLDNHHHDSKYWSVRYNNRHVETETFMLEKLRNKPSFLPTIGGDSSAVLSAYLLNLVIMKHINLTQICVCIYIYDTCMHIIMLTLIKYSMLQTYGENFTNLMSSILVS